MERRPFEIVYTVDELNRFASIGKDNTYFGVTIDFGHYATNGIGLPRLDQLQLPVYDVHLSQGTDGKVHKSLMLENGFVDIEGALRSLAQYGYEGSVILEIASDHRESRVLAEKILELI